MKNKQAFTLIKSLYSAPISRIETLRDDEARCGGFTLIELLVVVLIIGILAAVALPQYQRAVDKSRFMKMVQVVYGIKRAQETYYLANGNYSADLTALDIDYTAGCQVVGNNVNMFTCPDGFYMDLGLAWGLPTGAFSVTFCPDHNTGLSECVNNAIASFGIYFDHNRYEHLRGTSFCEGYTPRGEAICKSLQSMQ